MKKVLVVDDSITATRHLESIVNGCLDLTCVGMAKDGFEAIKMNYTENPDIIFMDINMPGMDGLTALRIMSAVDKDVTIVIVSSMGSAGDRFNEAIKLGAHTTITKPFTKQDILEVLQVI